jgi:hypothetical protein
MYIVFAPYSPKRDKTVLKEIMPESSPNLGREMDINFFIRKYLLHMGEIHCDNSI